MLLQLLPDLLRPSYMLTNIASGIDTFIITPVLKYEQVQSITSNKISALDATRLISVHQQIAATTKQVQKLCNVNSVNGQSFVDCFASAKQYQFHQNQ
ncbi:hypothetical protein Nepgr_012537 [Nepenthes gracilis]|uniref:Uncharacterized protein n=1 Tax=Nepenthes gracilis TaxID=150966 RepID=A0AAD3XNF7_NEPGR|nr:hypothetical protein Nepgr_012537 [Nepenthes gracilis]